MDADRNQPYHYWLLATSDLYNWHAQHALFSKNPQDLINLLETALFTHQPTYNDYGQFLSSLFTKEERNRILDATRKLVPGPMGAPTTDPVAINVYFPSTCPEWDCNMAQGKERLHVCRQALLAGLKASARKLTNMARVYDVRQEMNQSPAVCLECLLEAFWQYSPYDILRLRNRFR